MNINTSPLAPAISVIIPMYNAQKHIGACLEVILHQTFQDFEVIVVDDCSTDNSYNVVENFIPNFGGRLKLFQTKRNSGGPGEPSNLGVSLSRGKYIYVIDNDDLLVANALEVFYNYAEEFNADVVYTDRGFRFEANDEKLFPTGEDLIFAPWQGKEPTLNEPTIEPEDIAERVGIFCREEIGWTAWEKFVRRDLLIENNITFPIINSSADVAWTIEILCCAKKILRIPNPLYIYRENPDSITRQSRDTRQQAKFWMEINIKGLKFLDDWLSNVKFFQENPNYKWDLLEMFSHIHFRCIEKLFYTIPPQEIYEISKACFKETFQESSLIAYLLTSLNFFEWRWMLTSGRVLELEDQLRQIQGG